MHIHQSAKPTTQTSNCRFMHAPGYFVMFLLPLMSSNVMPSAETQIDYHVSEELLKSIA